MPKEKSINESLKEKNISEEEAIEKIFENAGRSVALLNQAFNSTAGKSLKGTQAFKNFMESEASRRSHASAYGNTASQKSKEETSDEKSFVDSIEEKRKREKNQENSIV